MERNERFLFGLMSLFVEYLIPVVGQREAVIMVLGG